MNFTLFKKAISTLIIAVLFSGSVAYGAIAHVATVVGTNTNSFTGPNCTGDNMYILLVGGGAFNLPSATYDGVSMSSIATWSNSRGGVFGIKPSSTGAKTINASFSSGATGNVIASCYSGVSGVEASNTSSISGSVFSVSTAVVSSAVGAWWVALGAGFSPYNNDQGTSRGSQTQNGLGDGIRVWDSNGTVSGNNGMSASSGSGNSPASITGVSLAPFVPVTTQVSQWGDF